MSVLNNATNVQIIGGQFNAFNERGSSKGLDLIREQSALSALLNSNERYDPPRCDEDTRIAIIQEIMDWVNSQEKSASMIVLHGPAGAGKSALEQSIAERCLREGRLAASFFFSRTALNRSDGNTLIPTLVYQLAQISPGLRKSISNVVIRDPAILKMTRMKQMEALFVAPFRKGSRWRRLLASFSNWNQKPLPRLIVVDGLDECSDPEVQCDLLRVIASTIPLLPVPFRFLVATRPESHIMNTVNHDAYLKAIQPRRIDLGKDPRADADIRTFLRKEFDHIRDTHPLGKHLPRSWPSTHDFDRLVEKASTQFIYAATVMKYVRCRKHRPDDRLKVIIRLSYDPIVTPDKPFAQLDALYAYIFSCVDDIDLVLCIFGVLYLSANRADEFELGVEHTTPVRLEETLGLRTGDVELALGELLSLIDISDRERPVKIHHASLFDFLLDPSRSGPFTLDLQLAHEALALSYFRTISSGPSVYKIDVEKRIRFVYLIWKHCKHARIGSDIRACFLSPLLLPFHLSFIGRDTRTDPVSALRVEWSVMEALESALGNPGLDPVLLSNLNDMAAPQVRNLMVWSPVNYIMKPFHPHFPRIIYESKRLPPAISKSTNLNIPNEIVVATMAETKFSLLLRLCIEHDKAVPDATYPKAIMVSSHFWAGETTEGLVRASSLVAQILFPLSTYYQPLVELLARSENVARVFRSTTSTASSPLTEAIMDYLGRIVSQVDASTWRQVRENCPLPD